MSRDNTCPECGGAMTPGEPCAACLLGVGLESMSDGRGPASSAWSPPTVEQLAGRFPELELIELLGRGGMGAVYKARQATLNRLVAVKILPPEIGRKPAFAERFAREAQSLARLNHPNIVTVHDFGERDGLYFFMMEFVDGVNLRQLLDTGRVASREALAIVPQICDALQCAHDQGIVHRDIKPENILMDRQGRVKIADFGLAKLVREGGTTAEGLENGDASGALSCTLAAVGTPAYMAPEQVAHPDEVDHRADIYALGVVFYQMLTGELPGKELEPPSLRGVRIDVRLDEIVLQALEQNPVRRYSQVSVLKTRLEAVTRDPAPQAGVPGTEQSSDRTPARRPWGWMVTFLILNTLAVKGVVIFFAYVMPRFVSVFSDLGMALPVVTQLTINLGHIIQHWVVLIVPLLILGNTAVCLLLTLARQRRLLIGWGLLVLLGFGVLLGAGGASLYLPQRKALQAMSAADSPREEDAKLRRDRQLARNPGKVRSLSLDRLIDVGMADPESPWSWQELERRARAGRLSSAETARLMAGLTVALPRTYPQGVRSSLTWLNQMLEALAKQGLVTDAQAVAFLSAYHGAPQMDPLPRLREGARVLDIQCNVSSLWHREILGLKLFNDLRSIALDGQPVACRAGFPKRFADHLSMSVELPPLSPGLHTVACSVDSALIASADTLGLEDRASAADWPAAKRRWIRSCKAEFRIYPREAEVVTRVDDPALDPVRSGGLVVKALAIHTTEGGTATNAVLMWDTSEKLAVPISFDVTLRLDGETYACGEMWQYRREHGGTSGSGSSLRVGVPPLAPEVRVADIVLTPNPAHVDQVAAIDRIWGQEIVLRDVPLGRHDLSGGDTSRVERVAAPAPDGHATPFDVAMNASPVLVRSVWPGLMAVASLLLVLFPLSILGVVWIVLGVRQGLATGRMALVLALTMPVCMVLLFSRWEVGGSMMHGSGPSRGLSLLLFPIAGEILAFVLGFRSRRTKAGRSAMVIAGILLLSLLLLV